MKNPNVISMAKIMTFLLRGTDPQIWSESLFWRKVRRRFPWFSPASKCWYRLIINFSSLSRSFSSLFLLRFTSTNSECKRLVFFCKVFSPSLLLLYMTRSSAVSWWCNIDSMREQCYQMLNSERRQNVLKRARCRNV